MGTVVVTGSNTRTVVVDRQRVASITAHRPDTRTVSDRRTATAVQERASVIGVSGMGVQGRAGEPGGQAESRDAASDLGGHRIVRSVSATAAGYASAADASHGDDTLGMTTGAALLGAPVTVQRYGAITHAGWAWTPGEPVFLGLDGVPTQTPPVAAFEQVIGYAEAADTLFLRIDPPIYVED